MWDRVQRANPNAYCEFGDALVKFPVRLVAIGVTCAFEALFLSFTLKCV